MKIIGIEARTSNAAEANPQIAQIPALWQKFFQVAENIPHRKNPDIVFGIYTHYQSDHRGSYSLIVSSEVNHLDEIPEGMIGVLLPAAKYLLFRAEGQMPAALIETWAQIWHYFSENTTYERAYTADYERHDGRNQSKIELYIAVK